jgi:membrane-associated HD superfamily phosphohydrolase
MQDSLSRKTSGNNTLEQYRQVVGRCKDLYVKKAQDYGTSWRVLRTISIVDQIYIKACRIRQIQETGVQKIGDSIESEFVAIVNYGIIALIQSALKGNDNTELSAEEARTQYEQRAQETEDLMMQKNHDYGEAWREMSQQSFVDLILVKLLRIKQILANEGQTIVSEGIDANFHDIVNYAIFALILSGENRS